MRSQRILLGLMIINSLFLLAAFAHARSPAPQATPAVLRARMLELVDQSGQVRSRLSIESSGEVVFRLLDQDGTIRVKLGAAKDGSGLVLLNHATEPGVHLLANGSVKLRDKDGRERLFTP